MRIIPTLDTLRRVKESSQAKANRKMRRSVRESSGDVTGLKLWFVPGLDHDVLTPYGRKERRRRRAARRVAHESRRTNAQGQRRGAGKKRRPE